MEPEIKDHLRVKEILEECALLAEKKNKDYAKPGDPLHNFRRCKVLGIPVSYTNTSPRRRK